MQSASNPTLSANARKTEYRQIKPYWTKRFEKVTDPLSCVLYGMDPPVPEVTVLIPNVTTNRRVGEYELHIKKVLGFKRLLR